MVDTELLATTTIQARLARCPRLRSFIASNDKTPLTDGSINLYLKPGYRKTDLRGSVLVQVKGRSESRSGPEAAYRIPRDDLSAYRRLGGVLYFVVFVDASGHGSPYYINLPPFTIDELLGAQGSKKSVKVALRALPEEPAALEGIVGVALATQKQLHAPFTGEGFDRLTALTVRSAKAIDLTAPMTISSATGDWALEATTIDGLTVALPGIVIISPASYEGQEVDLEVSAGNVTYSKASVRQLGPDQHEIAVSDNLKFQFHTGEGNNWCSVTLTLAGTLAQRAKDVEFYLAIIDTGILSFRGDEYEVQLSGFSDLDTLRGHAKFLDTLLRLFEALHVDPQLVPLEELSETTLRQLEQINRSIILGEQLLGRGARPGSILVELGPWRLLLIFTQGSKPDTRRYIDPFDPLNGNFLLRRSSEAAQRPATVYEYISPTNLPTILNLRLGQVTDAYERLSDAPEAQHLANLQVLALITAADRSSERKDEFLAAAEALNEWLIRKTEPTDVHLINRWQIMHRRTGVDRELGSEIRAARRRATAADAENLAQVETSFAILLGNVDDVDDCVMRLTPEDRKLMETWPIWALRPTETTPNGVDGRGESAEQPLPNP
jgi:hypothetical protein